MLLLCIPLCNKFYEFAVMFILYFHGQEKFVDVPISINVLPHEKTNNVVLEQARNKLGCTATEDS